MGVALIALWLILCITAGSGIGYTIAVATTDRILARMTDDELKALASRVRRRKG